MIPMARTNYKEKAEGEIPADAWITSIIKISCIFVIGLVIIGGITTASNITASSPFYAMYNSVLGNFESGYSLAALMILIISAAAILHFMGFL
jgi:hypothetical protein